MKGLMALITGLLVSGVVFAAHPGIESQESYGNVLLEHDKPGTQSERIRGPESLQSVLDREDNWGGVLYDLNKPVAPAMLPPEYGDVTAPGYDAETYGSVLDDVGIQF